MEAESEVKDGLQPDDDTARSVVPTEADRSEVDERRTDLNVWFLIRMSALFCFFPTAAMLVAGFDASGVAGYRDQEAFHIPSIKAIAAEFSLSTLDGLPTATTPLLHITGAVFIALFHIPTELVAVVAAACAGGLLVAIVAMLRPVVGEYLAYLSVLPLILSPYFVQSVLWFNTDSVAVLLVLLALLLLIKGRGSLPLFRLLTVGVLLLVAILVRQSSVWVLPVIAVILVMDGKGKSVQTVIFRLVLTLLPALIGLGAFVLLWGGLTPPLANEFNNSGRSVVAIPYSIIVFGIVFTPLVLAVPAGRSLIAGLLTRRVAIGAAVAGLGIGAVCASVPSAEAGRHGGAVWAVVGQGISVFDRSVLFILLVSAALVGLVRVLSSLAMMDALVVAVGLGSVSLVVAVGSQVFQRYVELPALALFSFVFVQLVIRSSPIRIWPIYLIATGQAILTLGVVVLPTLGVVS